MGYSSPTHAKIASGTSLTGEIDLRGRRLVGIQFPSAWTAADCSLQIAAAPGGAYGEVFYDTGDGTGTVMAVDASASKATMIPSAVAPCNCMLKVRSGPSGAAVNQLADRDLVLYTVFS